MDDSNPLVDASKEIRTFAQAWDSFSKHVRDTALKTGYRTSENVNDTIELTEFIDYLVKRGEPSLVERTVYRDDIEDDWEYEHSECPNCGLEHYNPKTGRCSSCHDHYYG